MAESLKERQARLAEKLKNEPPKAPIQEVNPVVEPEVKPASKSTQSADDELVQLNAKVPKSLLKKVRRIAVEDEMEIRDIVRHALEAFVNNR